MAIATVQSRARAMDTGLLPFEPITPVDTEATVPRPE